MSAELAMESPPSRLIDPARLLGDAGVLLLAGVMAALSIAIVASGALPAGAVAGGLHVPWWVLVLGFVAVELVVVHLPFGRNTYSFSLSEIPLTVALVSLAPVTVVAVRLLGSSIGLAAGRVRGVKLAFNLASVTLETCCAALVFRALLGDSSPVGPFGWAAALVASLAVAVLSASTITGAISMHQRRFDTVALLEVLATGALAAIANTGAAVITIIVLHHDARGAVALGVLAAVLVVAHRSWTALSRRHAELQVLCEFVTALSDNGDRPAVIASVLGEARRLLRAESGQLIVFSSAGAADTWFRLDETGLTCVDASAHASWWRVLGHEHAQRFSQRTRDRHLRMALEALGIDDAVIAPMRARRGIIGAVMVADRLDDVSTFSDDDVRLLETLAGHGGVELENRTLLERLRQEVTEREHQALHDQLTSLPNRRCFTTAAEAALRAGEEIAVMLMDLDRFKEINDTLGHAAGDRVLTAVAARISTVLGPDVLTARFGGDEFAVLLPTASATDVEAAGVALLVALEEPVPLGDLAVDVGASIGVALAPADGDEADVLIQRADVAMYLAKEHRTGVELYAAERDVNDVRKLALVAELRQDVADERLELAFQPQADISTGIVLGVEALVRWPSREGLVMPDEFVPIAEATGLDRPLTGYVLRQALGQVAAWRRARPGREISMAVNLATRSLLDASFPDLVADELAAAGVPPSCLTLEITESTIMRDADRILGVLMRLTRLGVRLSIDDFGTGYSSLGYLRRLPVHEVKIDRSFLTRLPADVGNQVIVNAIISLGHELGLHVVAEGVEDEGTLAMLRAAGCDVMQGYLLAAPLPPDEIDSLLDTGPTLASTGR